MIKRLYIPLVLFLALLSTSCNNDLRKLDYNDLPIEYMNEIDNYNPSNFSFTTLNSEAHISSSTNKFNLSSELKSFIKTMLSEHSTSINDEFEIEDWDRFVEFTNGVITNDNPRRTVNLTTNEENIVVIKHMGSGYANAESSMKDRDQFRFDGIIKYDFKITLNPNGDRCEKMKHVVYLDDCVFYSSSKL